MPPERTLEMPVSGRVVVAHPQREPAALRLARELGVSYFLNEAVPREDGPLVLDQDG